MTTKERVLAALADARDMADTEVAHQRADDALLDYIDDPDIRAAFTALKKWYA